MFLQAGEADAEQADGRQAPAITWVRDDRDLSVPVGGANVPITPANTGQIAPGDDTAHAANFT